MQYFLLGDRYLFKKYKKIFLLYFLTLIITSLIFTIFSSKFQMEDKFSVVLGMNISNNFLEILTYLMNIGFYSFFSLIFFFENIINSYQNIFLRFNKKKIILNRLLLLLLEIIILKIITSISVSIIINIGIDFTLFYKDIFFALFISLLVIMLVSLSKTNIILYISIIILLMLNINNITAINFHITYLGLIILILFLVITKFENIFSFIYERKI